MYFKEINYTVASPILTKSRITSKEIKRLWLNWILFILLGVVDFVSILSTLPTQHQFITNPVSGALNLTQTSLKVQPGLGQSETMYSVAIAFRCTGAFIASVITGFLIQVIPYWHLNLYSLVSHTIGWTIYATAVYGWMILLSKLLTGSFIGMHYTLTYAYFGQRFEDYVAAQKELDNYGKSQAAVKDILFALHGLAIYLAYIIGLGVPLLLTFFDVNQFRAIGWFNVMVGLIFIVLQLLLLRGESECKKCDMQGVKCRCGGGKKPEINWMAVFLVVFLVLGRAVVTSRISVVETLFNPIFSDSFGLSAKWDSYLFFVLIVPVIIGAFATLILLLLNFNIRIIAIIGVTTGIIGALLMSDWQSIPYDPCTEFSLFHHPELADEYLGENNLTIFPSTDTSSDFRQAREVFVYIQNLKVFKQSVYDVARNKCEEARIGSHRCHWIPDSIISKELCTDCQPICRSVDRSLNFIQYFIGIVLFDFSQPPARVSFTAMISNQVRRDLQGIVMGFASASAGVLLSIAPLWLDATYEGVGKRTFLPLAILTATLLLLLVGLIVLYPRLGQKSTDPKLTNEYEGKEAILEAADEEDATESSQLITEKQ